MRVALHYYSEYQDEIDTWIRQVEKDAERAEALWRWEQKTLRR